MTDTWLGSVCAPVSLEVSHHLITGPSLEPLDLDEFKKSIKFSSTSEDTLIDVFISAARQHFSEQTGRPTTDEVWEQWIEGTPVGRVELPHPPLREVISVTYGDVGDETTMDADAYTVIAPSGPHAARGVISLGLTSWPSASNYRVRYRAGYGPQIGDVPELVRVTIALLAAHFHKYRSEVQETKFAGAMQPLPLGAKQLIDAFKYSALPIYPLRGIAPWA